MSILSDDKRSPAVPELLAPAGGPEALRAAVSNGADAVYLGVRTLNARRGAENFDLAGLEEATRYAHLRGVRVYLTANIAVLESEMRDALETVRSAWEAGVDAVIVQDLGLLSLVRRLLPEVRVHGSTQIDVHNAGAVRALESLGVSRITLARELSTTEIAALVGTSGVELESFVHGALCFCHSGQCLFSSMIGGRSGNRGLCAQPCRMPYELVERAAGTAEVPGRYLLSPKDLAGITVLPALVRSGVAALKIEGRMKSPEYVATVVGVYRAALDRAAADPDGFAVKKAEWDMLSEAFSRGFTEAYLSDIRDDAMMSYKRPNNRGVTVGRVTGVRSGRIDVDLTRAVEVGDTLEFWTSSGHGAQVVEELFVEGRAVRTAPAGSHASLPAPPNARTGDRVFRVANAALLSAARRTFAPGVELRRVPLEIGVVLREGEPAAVTVHARGASGKAVGEPVERARTKAVTAGEIMEHVGRLGGTHYDVAAWRIDLGNDVGIGFSALHGLRREAIERLEARLLSPWTDRHTTLLAADEPQLPGPAPRPARTELVAAVADEVMAAACVAAGADRVLLAVTSADGPRALPDRVEPLLPRVAHDAEVAALLDHARPSNAATAGNLGLVASLANEGMRVDADWGLGEINPWCAETLARLGAGMIWASPELSRTQLASLAASSPVPVGCLVHGHIELMVAEHCVLQAAGGCAHDCAACGQPERSWVLRDRKDYEFPVTTDAAGRTHIYNSVSLDLSRSLGDIAAAGVSAVRLELQTATADEAARVVGAYRRAVDAVAAGAGPPTEPLVTPSTGGHFFRGVR